MYYLKGLQKEFIENLTERTEIIEQSILSLENQPADIRQIIKFLLREVHSIKGNAAAFQCKMIQILCHRMEDLFIEKNDSEIIKQTDDLLKYCDAINDYSRIFKGYQEVNNNDFLKKHSFCFKGYSDQKNNLSILSENEILSPNLIQPRDAFSAYKINKVLFLDDEDSILELCRIELEHKLDCQFLFLLAEPGVLLTAQGFAPDLIISDINMPGIDVLELMTFFCHARFIFLTGDISSPICRELNGKGALGVFDKSSILGGLLGHLINLGAKLKE